MVFRDQSGCFHGASGQKEIEHVFLRPVQRIAPCRHPVDTLAGLSVKSGPHRTAGLREQGWLETTPCMYVRPWRLFSCVQQRRCVRWSQSLDALMSVAGENIMPNHPSTRFTAPTRPTKPVPRHSVGLSYMPPQKSTPSQPPQWRRQQRVGSPRWRS